MCYADDAVPPDHGRAGSAAGAEDLVLTSADGTRFAAHLARAAAPSGRGVVILPDVRGLHQFYRELAERFAAAGIDAIAFDYFGRTAGSEPRGADFEWQQHLAQATDEVVAADTAAAITELRRGGRVAGVFTVGFCFGGAKSWRQSAAQPGLSGAIGFYGRPPAARDAIPDMKAPLLLLLAGDDAATPREDFEKFDGELTGAGVEHHMVIYDGAPHSFFDRAFAQYQDACRDAWEQIFAFMAEHTAVAA